VVSALVVQSTEGAAAWLTAVGTVGATVVAVVVASFSARAVRRERRTALEREQLHEAYRVQVVLAGRLLMDDTLFEAASEVGCSRVEWTTDAGNEGARALCESLGFAGSDAKVYYRAGDAGTGPPAAGHTRSA
jgi:hypothetical protein